MFAYLRHHILKPVNFLYNEYTKHFFKQRRVRISITSYPIYKVNEFKNNYLCFRKYLTGRSGFSAFIVAICYEKEKEEENVKYKIKNEHNEEFLNFEEESNNRKIINEFVAKCDSGINHNYESKCSKDGNKCADEKDNEHLMEDNSKTHNESGKEKGDSKCNFNEMKNSREKSNVDSEKEHKKAQSPDDLFMEAARFGNILDIKRLLRDGVDVNQHHSFGWTALQVATINGHFRVVVELLSYGANPNLGDNFSSVNEIAWERKLESEEVMTVRKQDFFPKMKMQGNCANFTALHYAVLVEDHDIASILLRAGADPTVVSETGFSPLDFAKSDKMRNLLKKYMNEDDEDMMKLNAYVQRLVRKGYSVNIVSPEKENKEAGCNTIRLQIKDIHTDKVIKDVNITIKLKHFVTV